MSLNCGHVFCQFCINQWKEKCSKKSDFTCPNCREPVKSQNRSLHLENLISSLFADVEDSIKEERKILIQERQDEIKKAEIGKKHALKKYDQFGRNTSCFWGST